MPLVDNSALAYDNVIYDWIAGDSREFVRAYTFVAPNAGDSVVAAFLTLKQNPNDIDQNALLQIKITQVASANGIVAIAGAVSNLQFIIFAAQYQAQVQAGTVYYYDIRLQTANGLSFTAETGTIFFKQGVTQAFASGTPAAQPDQGLPIFRGFASAAPIQGGPYVVGDYFLNNNPVSGAPTGWQCIAGGIPGVWRTSGIVGDTDGT